MRVFPKSFLLLVLCCPFTFASSNSLPLFQVPDCLGVNIHFVEPDAKQLDMIENAGFGMIRMDFVWSRVERKKGEYDFSGYLRLTDALRQRNIIPLYILDYSNELYEKERSVVTEEGRNAFARFAAAAVRAMGESPVLWEIWNEPNLDHFWEKPNPGKYVLLVEAASKAMREVNPECTILAPAASRIPLGFIEACFDRGMLKWIDAVSVHPYRTKEPETAMNEYAQLRGMMDRYSDGKNLPILSGEWGYSIHKYGNLLVDEHMQAQFIVRQFLTNFLSGVRVSIWYDWHDDGSDPEEREHNFGTVKRDFTPKETYKAAQVFCKQLNGLTLVNHTHLPDSNAYWAAFGVNGKPEVIVGWTTGYACDAPLQQKAVKEHAVTMLGETVQLKKSQDGWMAPLSQSPIYIHLGDQ